MPTPRKNESKDSFIERCIPVVIEDGTAEDGSQARAVCESMWEREDNTLSFYLIDEYVAVSPGEPYRLFPFGKIVKNGKERNITPEIAKRFRLPHFRPPIKLGSHKEETPAGGHIVGLEVRTDGLYAIPNLTEKGGKAISDGDYKYHSPEVIWEGGFEDPKTGETIDGPLIVGDALLHMPHLGEAAALYEVETTQLEKENKTMSDEMVQVPKTFWEKAETLLFGAKQQEPGSEPKDETKADEFDAVIEERDNYKAQLEDLKAEREQAELYDAVKGEFDTEEFGAAYAEMGQADENVQKLAGLDKETREWVLEQFRALSKQIEESQLIEEKGSDDEGLPDDPVAKFNSVVEKKAQEDGIDYNTAMQIVVKEQPGLYEEYKGGK